MRLLLSTLAASILAATAVAAFAQHDHGSAPPFPDVCRSAGVTMAEGHAGHDTGAMKDHQKAAMTGMMAMDRDMQQAMMKDDADVAFMCGMIAHHQGAIDMAKVEIDHGDDAAAKAFAQKVIEAQTQEIAEMTDWLAKNAQP